MTAPVESGRKPCAPAAAEGTPGGASGDRTARQRAWLASWERALAAAPARRKAKQLAAPVPSPPVVAPTPSFVLRPSGPAAELASTRAAASRSAGPAGESGARDPLRWHAEWSAAGVRVWLGSDLGREAGGEQIQAVVAEVVRQLGARGVRVLSVVCNGLEVWSSAGERRREPSMEEEP